MLRINLHKKIIFSQPEETNTKQLKTVVTFLTGCNGIFKVPNKKNKFNFEKSIIDKNGFTQTTIRAGAYDNESVSNEIRWIIFEER